MQPASCALNVHGAFLAAMAAWQGPQHTWGGAITGWRLRVGCRLNAGALQRVCAVIILPLCVVCPAAQLLRSVDGRPSCGVDEHKRQSTVTTGGLASNFWHAHACPAPPPSARLAIIQALALHASVHSGRGAEAAQRHRGLLELLGP
jgi:hypothetical protein